MKAIELFAGIGGFRVAVDSQKINTVWANDLCPKACAVYRSNFGKTELHEGDINQLKEGIPAHDLLTGGFPCQPFSSAGKKKGIHDPRGTLFEVIVDVLRSHQPKYFIIENVKRLLTMERGLHFATILASLAELNYRIEWRLLNAMHFGLPQNRQRVFLLGIQNAVEFNAGPGSVKSRMASPADLSGLNENELEKFDDMGYWTPIERHGVRFPSWGLAAEGKFFGADLEEFSQQSASVAIHQVLQESVSEEFDFTESTLQWLSKNTPVNRFVQGVEILSNQAGGARMGYTIFGINGVAPTLTSTTSRHYERYKIGERFRRLTNIEYARIQGFPDDHCDVVSVYDQYSLFGNAAPPPMARWVMDKINTVGISVDSLPHKTKYRTLFDYANER